MYGGRDYDLERLRVYSFKKFDTCNRVLKTASLISDFLIC